MEHDFASPFQICLALLREPHRKEQHLKETLESLVEQMHSTGIFFSEGKREFSRRFIMHVLKVCKGNQCRAARELGMHRNTLSRAIAELKIDVRQLRSGRRYSPSADQPHKLQATADALGRMEPRRIKEAMGKAARTGA